MEKNQRIRRCTGVNAKAQEAHLHWLGHVLSMKEGRMLRQVLDMDAVDSGRRDRPELRWKDIVERHIREVRVWREGSQYRRVWIGKPVQPTPTRMWD